MIFTQNQIKIFQIILQLKIAAHFLYTANENNTDHHIRENDMKNYFSRMKTKGHCPPRKPLRKIIWSSIGAFLGILFIAYLGEVWSNHDTSSLFLIGSFGASAVLIYGAPLVEFSQPRNLIGGHILSGLVGVTVALLLKENMMIASALAVSSAIAVMHFTRTLHPPGGATALIAVIGGDSIQDLGYWYVVSPVFIGAFLMLLVALFINNMSIDPQRHYPVYWV
jgi:CBS domain-containing membrane protein